MDNFSDTDMPKRELIPDDVRSRLNGLAKKLDEERQNLDEVRLLREAEVKALQSELAKRDSAWESEKKLLHQEINKWKTQYEIYQKKEEQWNKKQSEWENERNKWETQTQFYYKDDIQRLEEKIRTKEKAWNLEKAALEQTVKKLETDIQDLKRDHALKLQETETQYKEIMNKEIADIEKMLNNACDSWHKKKIE
ncbi:MAG: hypothetical protein HY811_01595 [Planctomycetes bacterium]|nr:hypothetical protein [Planctomycetota bacterium]